jgi:hypothetical protein
MNEKLFKTLNEAVELHNITNDAKTDAVSANDVIFHGVGCLETIIPNYGSSVLTESVSSEDAEADLDESMVAEACTNLLEIVGSIHSLNKALKQNEYHGEGKDEVEGQHIEADRIKKAAEDSKAPADEANKAIEAGDKEIIKGLRSRIGGKYYNSAYKTAFKQYAKNGGSDADLSKFGLAKDPNTGRISYTMSQDELNQIDDRIKGSRKYKKMHDRLVSQHQAPLDAQKKAQETLSNYDKGGVVSKAAADAKATRLSNIEHAKNVNSMARQNFALNHKFMSKLGLGKLIYGLTPEEKKAKADAAAAKEKAAQEAAAAKEKATKEAAAKQAAQEAAAAKEKATKEAAAKQAAEAPADKPVSKKEGLISRIFHTVNSKRIGSLAARNVEARIAGATRPAVPAPSPAPKAAVPATVAPVPAVVAPKVEAKPAAPVAAAPKVEAKPVAPKAAPVASAPKAETKPVTKAPAKKEAKKPADKPVAPAPAPKKTEPRA